MIGPGFGESDKYLIEQAQGRLPKSATIRGIFGSNTCSFASLWPANKDEQLSEAVAKKSAVYVRISKNIELSKLREAELQEVV